MDKFLERAGIRGLLKQVPESFVPDMQAISDYHKKTGGALPDGCQLIPGETKFSYTTIDGENDGTETDRDTAETGAAA